MSLSECDIEAPIMRRPDRTGGCCVTVKKKREKKFPGHICVKEYLELFIILKVINWVGIIIPYVAFVIHFGSFLSREHNSIQGIHFVA